MAVAATGFKWLDILEKEFDKAYVDVDLLISDLDGEEGAGEFLAAARGRLATLASCFSQLAHKSQTIFQTNAKLEAELLNCKSELARAEGQRVAAEKELDDAVRQLHAALLQVHKLQDDVDEDISTIQQRLDSELAQKKESLAQEAEHQARLALAERENANWLKYASELHSELYGARLTAKYLDKELAGRIQQMQLLGREMKPEIRDKLWDQLEAEIHLHRHKSVIQVCRRMSKMSMQQTNDDVPAVRTYGTERYGTIRKVTLHKDADEALGMSITGGKDHGIPVIISELQENGPAHNSGLLSVGDAILSVNGVDLKNVLHEEAVEILSSQDEVVDMLVQYIPSTPEPSDEEEAQNQRYPFFTEEETPSVVSQSNTETST